ncbi:MAG: T9SS type A sorting domain-containing protein [Ignavibacteria bacterium]|jgi:hypothetical protein
MKFFTFLNRTKTLRILLLLIMALGGTMLLQAQPLNDNDYRFDLPTKKYLNTFIPPQYMVPMTVTDANGYDNFQIGTNYSEQGMTVNPNNPLQMMFGVNNTSALSIWYTTDGLNWNVAGASYPGGTCCDPWTAYDSVGNLFFSVLVSANYVARSTNFGQTWGGFVYACPGTDRNSIAADYTGGPYANNLYTSAWSPNCSFCRSTDHGASWTTIYTTSNTTPGNMICVGPSPNGAVQGGSVYFVSITGSNPAPSTFNFFRSTDGGASMQVMSSGAISPGYVGTLNSASRLVINNARTRPYPMIACDNSYGTYRGRLYCVYSSNVPAGNGNKPDIKCQYSTDGGATWSSEVIVNDNANPTISDQWYPAIWCEKTTGKLYVKWYDTRNNPSTYGVDVYASYSTNGGQSFVTNQKLTNANWTYPCPGCSPNTNCYMGDYDAIVGNPLCGFAVWYDGRNCTFQNMGSYFPDFALLTRPSTLTMNGVNDSSFVFVSVPSVKLYTDKAKFTATVSPIPPTGTITLSFLNRSNYNSQDSLTAYPDSLRMRIKTSGGVTNQAYTITLLGKGSNGTPIHMRTISLTVITGINLIGSEVPIDFKLYQNYPNPFNPTTQIRFDLAKAGIVKLSVYDINGRLVQTLLNTNYSAGKYNAEFDAKNFSSGIYFYKLETPDYTSIKKMILVK